MTENPVLSICIPTYNRSKLLDALLEHISRFDRDKILTRLEICISDNASPDETPDILEKWGRVLSIKSERQSSNIGASANLFCVTKMASTNWVYLIGDDDLIIESGLAFVLDILDEATPDTWILPAIQHPTEPSYLSGLSAGSCSADALKRHILNYGVGHLGFIGSHIISTYFLKVLWADGIEQHFGWPHLSLMFKCLYDAHFLVVTEPIAHQSADVDALSWTWEEWLRMHAMRSMLCVNSLPNSFIFKLKLLARDYRVYLGVLAASRLSRASYQTTMGAISPYIKKLKINGIFKLGIRFVLTGIAGCPVGLLKLGYLVLNRPMPDLNKGRIDTNTNGVIRKL